MLIGTGTMGNKNEIDIVYAWVDGNDPEWRIRHDRFKNIRTTVDANCKGRYANNDELKYSLRTVDLYAPWVRTIFILTDNQVPKWLDTSNPKVKIVDHKDILPVEAMPCFNSSVFEHFIWKIPGLSECFLYANDDMFFNKHVSPYDFFGDDGYPIIRLKRNRLDGISMFIKEKILCKPRTAYKQTIINSAKLVECRYGYVYKDRIHHNIDAYRKSDFQLTFEEFMPEIMATVKNHFRNPNDIDRIIYNISSLSRGHGHVQYCGRDESLRIGIEKPWTYRRIDRYDPILFCLNDSQHVSDEDRKFEKEFLMKRYPEKSQFER